MTNKISSTILYWFFIPLILIGFWLGLSLFTIDPEIGFTALRTEYSESSFTQYKTTELYQGDIISAVFKAKENNLGTIAVRFNTLFRDNYDWLIFRIREQGKDDWIYENKYKVDQFQPDALFPFGFPIISNSIHKTYYFEIESTSGIIGNSVAISSKSPIFVAKYQYSRLEIMAGYEQLLSFMSKKIINSFDNLYFLVTSLVFAIPLVVYIFLLISISSVPIKLKKIPKIKQNSSRKVLVYNLIKTNIIRLKNQLSNRASVNKLILGIYSVILSLYILFSRQKNGFTEILLIIFGVFLLRLNRTSSKISFAIALGILLSCPFLFAAKYTNSAENAALWAYVFLVLGTFQAIWEKRNSR